MKRVVSLALTFIFVICLFSACSNSEITPSPVPAPSPALEETEIPFEDWEAAEEIDEPQDTIPEISENKEVVSSAHAPEIFMLIDADSESARMVYHLKDCPEIAGEDATEVSWEYVQLIGFWQCPKCNPPRYEDYKNAE
ncbi:MAG: hypothetical protein IKU87_00540 [Clostridia bacterium]|nr:hypothetical protein [Clostridia bacterium]